MGSAAVVELAGRPIQIFMFCGILPDITTHLERHEKE